MELLAVYGTFLMSLCIDVLKIVFMIFGIVCMYKYIRAK